MFSYCNSRKRIDSIYGDNPSKTSPPTITIEKDGSGSTEACSIPDSIGQDTVRHLDATQYTAEQEVLFERRFEEGCDIFIHKEYIEWLKINHPEFHIKDNSSTETADDLCGQPATSRDLSKDLTTSNVVSNDVLGPTSSLSDFLVCPALNNLESDVPKRPPTRAQLLTSHESLKLLEDKEQKMETDTMEKEKRKNKSAAKKKEELMQKKERRKGQKS